MFNPPKEFHLKHEISPSNLTQADMSISDSQQKREAVVEDFRTIRLSNGRNLTEDTPQTAVSPWNYPTTRSCGFSQVTLTLHLYSS